MIILTRPTESIEGLKISGQCRYLLQNKGRKLLYNNLSVWRFKAEYDIRSHIKEPLKNKTIRIEPTAHYDPNYKIICEKAIIHSLGNKYSIKINKASGSLRGVFWDFPKQTAVIIKYSHPEIENAIINRKLKRVRNYLISGK